MKSRLAMLFAAIVALLLLSPGVAHATAIRGGSNYGPKSSSIPCTSPCEAILPTSPITIGGTSYGVFEFDGNGSLSDVIDIGAAAAGASVSSPFIIDIPVLNTDVVNSDGINGVFACGPNFGGSAGDGATIVTDSGGSTVTSTCTPDSNAYSSVISDKAIAGAVEYTITGNIPELALFTTHGNLNYGNTIPAPEPSSLFLLGIALLSLVFFTRRRAQA